MWRSRENEKEKVKDREGNERENLRETERNRDVNKI